MLTDILMELREEGKVVSDCFHDAIVIFSFALVFCAFTGLSLIHILSTSTNIYLRRPDGRIATVEESMVRCARAGYRVMDLNFYDCTSFKSAFITDDWRTWIEDIRMLADQLGLTFSQAHGSFYNFCEKNLPEREFWETSVRRSILCCLLYTS